MNAEILCVGTELLLGDIVNTNAAFLARELAACGISCYYQAVVGDNPERLRESLHTSLSRSEIVITTGGLGPTYDDLTKETVADYFGLPMELHQPSLDSMVAVFRRLGHTMTENNKKQAYMPKGATVFPNDRGTAPGLAVQANGKTVILLPGPPREMTAMFTNQVKPFLLQKSGQTFLSHVVHFFGIGESSLEQELREFMESHTNPTVAPYAKEGEVQLRVTASAATAEEAEALIQPVVQELQQRYAKYIYGVDVGTLQNALVQTLCEKKLTIATAESCTGGLVSKRITEIAGVSNVFGCGLCTYANEMKESLLGVSSETLQQYGAVSAQTATEMARGVRQRIGADIGLAITGIAGPGGATETKPVGLVYIAAATRDGETVQELHLSRSYGDEREYIRASAASHALHLALRTAQGLGEKRTYHETTEATQETTT